MTIPLRLLLVVALGLLAQPALRAAEPLAEVEVKAERPLAIGTLKDGAPINTNRSYAFRGVPEALQGLPYVSHGHKTPATYQVNVTKGGALYLLLGEVQAGALPPTGLEFQPAGRLEGTDAGAALRDWVILKAEVKVGQTGLIPGFNKWGAVLVAKSIKLAAPPPDFFISETYRQLQQELAKRPHGEAAERVASQAFRPEALVLDTDRDPLDILLRRTAALLHCLQAMPNGPDLSAEVTELAKLRQQADGIEPPRADERRKVFNQLAPLRRRIAFSNPLLNFDRLVFLTHRRSKSNHGASHMCDQYFGFNANPDGSVYVLEHPFSERPEAVDLLADAKVGNGRLKGHKLEPGAFISLELSYDAQMLYFAYTEAADTWSKWTPESTYHLFKVGVDGRGLTQLTDGVWDDFDPCELPNGRLAFISERRGGFGRCHGRPVPSYTLHDCNPDGSDIRTLSYHETNEWQPSVDHNGMLVYTRWDYVDRDSDIAHHAWLCYPDGRDPRSYHGNYPDTRELRPWMEMSLRAIPGSHKYVAVAAPHHGQAYGSLVMLDQRLTDDRAMSQLRRLTPETHLPEAEVSAGVPAERGKRGNSGSQVYGTPWPLSEDFYLCVSDPGQNHYGIYLVDSFGNRELIYRDPQIACLDPIPLRSRPAPPVIASPLPTHETGQTGTVAVMNVYDSELPWPDGTRISALRVVQVFPKSTPNADDPRIGLAAQSLARGVLGTAPVEPDGSAYFEVPAGVPVYFQALDARGLAVQTMRSDTYLHPGEQLTCQGCHERKRQTAAPATTPLALRRAPSKLTPEASGSYPLTFPRLVQPVLDRHCAQCHAQNGKAPGLSGTKLSGNGWSEAFNSLRRYGWGKSGGNGAIYGNQGSYSMPGKVGARASRLYRVLAGGHHDCNLPPEDLRRITLWLDCNSNYYGAYEETGKQARGEHVEPRVR